MKKVVCIVLVLLMALSLVGCAGMNYKKAMELFEEGSYAEARELFVELGDHEDSAEMVRACDVAIATELLANDKYAEALAKLDDLGELDIAVEYAEDLIENELYDTASAVLAELKNYGVDTKAMYVACAHGMLAEYVMENGEAKENDTYFIAMPNIDETTGFSIWYDEPKQSFSFVMLSEETLMGVHFEDGMFLQYNMDHSVPSTFMRVASNTASSFAPANGSMHSGTVDVATFTGTFTGGIAENDAEPLVIPGIETTSFESSLHYTPTRGYQIATMNMVATIFYEMEQILNENGFVGTINDMGFEAFEYVPSEE